MSSHCVLRGNTWWSPPKCVTQPSNSQLQTHRLLMMSHTSGERNWTIALNNISASHVTGSVCVSMLLAPLCRIKRTETSFMMAAGKAKTAERGRYEMRELRCALCVCLYHAGLSNTIYCHRWELLDLVTQKLQSWTSEAWGEERLCFLSCCFPPQITSPEADQHSVNQNEVINVLSWMWTKAANVGALLEGTTAGVLKVNHQ